MENREKLADIFVSEILDNKAENFDVRKLESEFDFYIKEANLSFNIENRLVELFTEAINESRFQGFEEGFRYRAAHAAA